MTALIKHPLLIEINTALFLRRMREKYGKPLSLEQIPQSEWEEVKAQGYDAVWLMGIWKRSRKSRECALKEPAVLDACRQWFSNCSDEDIAGSPYAVYDYTPCDDSPDTGKLRGILAAAGLKLFVDYVPNHMSLDHPWTVSSPRCFIQTSKEKAGKYPGLFFQTPQGNFLAHGKDPHFPSWTDTAQINFFSEQARGKAVETLLKIAQSSDGVRCDMAMLGIHRVFKSTWGAFIQETEPAVEFWSEVISKVRLQYPDFIFMAEAYWDTEWELQQFGFDFTYDKKLYDCLLHASARDVRGHLQAENEYQKRSVRFIENHDEARALEALGPDKSLAAAAVIATLPGMRFFQEGQSEGARVKLPVQLIRAPKEKTHSLTKDFYQKLLTYGKSPVLHQGQWELCTVMPAWEENSSWDHLLAWIWQEGKQVRLIAVNYSSAPAQGKLFWQSEKRSSGVIQLKDILTGETYGRDIQQIQSEGLFVDLDPWKVHLFEAEI